MKISKFQNSEAVSVERGETTCKQTYKMQII